MEPKVIQIKFEGLEKTVGVVADVWIRSLIDAIKATRYNEKTLRELELNLKEALYAVSSYQYELLRNQGSK